MARFQVRKRNPGAAALDFALLASDSIGLLKNIVGHIVFGVSGAAGARLVSAEAVWLGVAGAVLGAFLVWPALYKGWRKLKYEIQPIQFFSDRVELRAERGTLADELTDVRSAWLAFESGHHLHSSIKEAGMAPVSRVLMLDPDGHALPLYHRRQGQAESIDNTKRMIREATKVTLDVAKRGKDRQVEIRWFDGQLMNMVLADPGSRCAWVRLHYQVAGHDAETWPDIVIEWHRQHQLVELLEDGYRKMWDLARIPDAGEYEG